jgi:hypothetical protein
MTAAEPVTCPTCRTLNPPAAPACARCNSPLSATPVPASRAPAAVPLAPEAAAGTPAQRQRPRRTGRDERLRALSHADQRRIVRRVQIAGAAIVLLVLVIGGYVVWRHAPRRIDGGAVATEIGQQLGQQVAVRCPATPDRVAGTTFTCTATDSGGRQRTVEVTVTSDDGAYKWTLR